MSDTTKKADKKGFTKEERAAMKERAKELKASANKAEAEQGVVDKIAEMSEPERSMVEKLHALIKTHAPSLAPKLWYGMPAYTNDEGKIVCFFQSADKFGTRYATLGFNDSAHLDDGDFFPVAFALRELNASSEAKVIATIKKAVS
jgi:uncharacterized protein YdhG (YjbR/CyaY superfamily)